MLFRKQKALSVSFRKHAVHNTIGSPHLADMYQFRFKSHLNTYSLELSGLLHKYAVQSKSSSSYLHNNLGDNAIRDYSLYNENSPLQSHIWLHPGNDERWKGKYWITYKRLVNENCQQGCLPWQKILNISWKNSCTLRETH